MKSRFLNIFCVLYLFGTCDLTFGQSNKVSPKLDFDDAENKENSSVPIMPTIVQARTNEERGGGDSTLGKSNSGKTGPTIHGVRVTVDTRDNHKSKESKESVELTDGGKHSKRVGIHTDITFEITADDNDDSNATSSAQRVEEDASVPIYRGRGSSTSKNRKPNDPKAHWNPNFSNERRTYDNSGRVGVPLYGGHYPQYPQNVPLYTGTGDNHSGARRKGDAWNSYVPITSVWTTERYHSEHYRPNTVNGYRAPSWKPCYCLSSGAEEGRRRRDNNHDSSVLRPTSSVLEFVDGKIERPFSKK